MGEFVICLFFSLQNYVIAPLHVASKYGNLNIVTLLVEKGAKVDIPNKVFQLHAFKHLNYLSEKYVQHADF